MCESGPILSNSVNICIGNLPDKTEILDIKVVNDYDKNVLSVQHRVLSFVPTISSIVLLNC